MSRPKGEASSQQKTTKEGAPRAKKATPQKATAKARSGQATSGKAEGAPRHAPATVTPEAVEPRAPLLDYEARQQIAGVVVAVIGVALLVSALVPTTGMLTQAVDAFLRTLFGAGAILVPLALIAWSLTIFTQRAGLVPGRVIAGFALVALAVMAGMGITTPGCDADAGVLFNVATLRGRGGYVGNGLAWVLLSLFGQVAGLVVVVGIAVVGLVVVGLDVSQALAHARARHQQARMRSDERRQQRRAASWRDEAAFDCREVLPEDYTPTVLFDPQGPVRDEALRRPASQPRVRSATTVIPFDQAAVELQDFATPPTSVLTRAKAAGVAVTTLLDGEELEPENAYSGGQGEPNGAAHADEARADAPTRRPHMTLDASLPQPPQSLVNKRARRASSAWWDPADEWRRDSFDPNDLGDGTADSIVPGVIPGAPLYYEDVTDGSDERAATPASHNAAAPTDVRAEGLAMSAGAFAGLGADADSFEQARTAKRPGTVPAVRAEDAATGRQALVDDEPSALAPRKRSQAASKPFYAASCPLAEDAGAETSALPAQGAAGETQEAVCELPWEEPGTGASQAADGCAESSETTSGTDAAAPRRARSTGCASVFAQPSVQRDADDPAAASAAQTDAQGDLGDARPYELPPLRLAKRSNNGRGFVAEHSQDARETATALQSALAEFGVDACVVDWVEGPTFTTFRVRPGTGVRVGKISALEDDIARTLAATSVRIYSPVPGTSYVGVEVANGSRREVAFGDVLPCVTGGPLDFAVGLDAGGKPVHADLGKLPHLLIAGTTGSGKSVTVNSILLSMLMRDTPEELRLIIVDPKQVEFSEYAGIPHLAMPVVTDPRQAAAALQWAVTEMDRRYRVFSNLGVRDLASYNSLTKTQVGEQTGLSNLPCVVVVIDELADLMMVAKKDVEASIVRVAQLGRAAGIHLVIATQTPRAEIVTGLIRANVANRIALRVSKGTDSRIIIDQMGAEKLLPHGDMLFLEAAFGDVPRRIQGCNVTDGEKSAILAHIKSQPAAAPCAMAPMPGAGAQLTLDTAVEAGAPSAGGPSQGGTDDDPLAWEAAKLVVENQLGSTSMLQRRMKLGYARAGRVMDMLEEMGVVGPARGSKPRDVLVADLDELETLRNADISCGE